MSKQPHLLFFILLFTSPLFAQKIQSPDEFLPHKLGEQFTPHHLLVDYYKYVAAHSDQMQLKEYGRTNEERPLIYAVISSKQNLQNLEAIRLNNLKRAGLADGKPDESNPVAIVWLSMNVHGNEPSSSETSMLLLHRLVSGDSARYNEWFKNTVIIIDPCVNPDGYNRYTNWYTGVSERTPNTSPEAREHNEPWPQGRTNHYLFDLNRDWAWAVQVETQARLEIYQQWLPHIVADFHEMGYNEPYYFAPAAQPFHKLISPFQRDFQNEVGKNHSKYFDKQGWLYFTKEVFDLFYPSYGDTYPTFNGAIGMTYEQGGIRAGRSITTENGSNLLLRDRIEHHLTTALSTIEVGSMNANRLSQNFADFYQKSATQPLGQYKTYIIKATNSRDKIKSLMLLLDKHKIKYGRANATASVAAFDYTAGKETTTSVSSEDLVISTFQPKSVLTQVLFDVESELVDSLTYDITAWSIPHAFGLDAYATKQDLRPITSFTLAPFINVLSLQPASTPIYAYIGQWKAMNNARFLSHLEQRNVKVRVAREAFVAEGKSYPRGTLVITKADNLTLGEKFDREVLANASLFEQELTPITSGFMTKGADIGSSRNVLLSKPSVAVIYDEEGDPSSYGQVWYYFEQELHLPVTSISIEQMSKAKLANYNTIVMTDGKYQDLDSSKYEKLRQWIAEGGKLILIGDVLAAFEDRKGFNLTKFVVKKDEDTYRDAMRADQLKNRYAHFCDSERNSISDAIPGAVVKVTLDSSHPLAYGIGDTYYSLKTSSNCYQPLKNSWNVGYINGKLKKYGFIGTKLEDQLKGSAVFSVQNYKKGNIIYMIDNPLFRCFWQEGKLLFSNAIFMEMGN
jgi:hypothetical protein